MPGNINAASCTIPVFFCLFFLADIFTPGVQHSTIESLLRVTSYIPTLYRNWLLFEVLKVCNFFVQCKKQPGYKQG